MHELKTGVNKDITFTKTAIRPKFFNRCSLKICSAASDHKIPKFRVHWNLLKLSNLRENLSKYWSNVITMSWNWLIFCPGISYCLGLRATSNSYAACDKLPRLSALRNLSERSKGIKFSPCVIQALYYYNGFFCRDHAPWETVASDGRWWTE